MATKPEVIQSRHFRAAYSHFEQGHLCIFACVDCGREKSTIVRDWERIGGTGIPVPDGWKAELRAPAYGGRSEVVPRCDGCIGAACDRIADELLATA